MTDLVLISEIRWIVHGGGFNISSKDFPLNCFHSHTSCLHNWISKQVSCNASNSQIFFQGPFFQCISNQLVNHSKRSLYFQHGINISKPSKLFPQDNVFYYWLTETLFADLYILFMFSEGNSIDTPGPLHVRHFYFL